MILTTLVVIYSKELFLAHLNLKLALEKRLTSALIVVGLYKVGFSLSDLAGMKGF